MMLSHDQYGEELPKFMTAKQILESHQSRAEDRWSKPDFHGENVPESWSPDQFVETDAQVMERKARVADKSGLSASLAEHGVQNPVHLGVSPQPDPNLDSGDERQNPKPEIFSGHHRIAVMLRDNPEAPIPVEFHPDWQSSLQKQARMDSRPARTSARDRVRGFFRR